MTTELQEHLQTILGGAYTLERELGGGGMSRVFVAEEAALGRRVDVAGALAHAHRAGVVHRDVKPENILIADGGAVVADFGIAKAIHEARAAAGGDVRRSSTLTAAGTSLGTPTYMAPKQALGDPVDHRADLYALGAVAYELLVGRAPFDGRTAQQLLAAHATEPPEPLARRRPPRHPRSLRS
jgi:eukaryotic-like serine/threonine-protein kinase